MGIEMLGKVLVDRSCLRSTLVRAKSRIKVTVRERDRERERESKS